MSISVVIPAINEEEFIRNSISSALASMEVECVVVDGGSTDNTRAIAEESGARVFSTLPGRARQLNVGVKNASGEVLVLLHADSVLPGGWLYEVQKFFVNPVYSYGCFRLSLFPKRLRSSLVSWGANRRTALFSLPYGDQGLMFRRHDLANLGGVPETRLEDLELVKKANKKGKLFVSKLSVKSSARKWEEHGYLRTTLHHQRMLLGNLL